MLVLRSGHETDVVDVGQTTSVLGTPGKGDLEFAAEVLGILVTQEEVGQRAGIGRDVETFIAAPAGLALLLGHTWNRVAPTTLWEDLGLDGYEVAFRLTA